MDHIIELQVLPSSMFSALDSIDNYELLDETSNRASGKRLDLAIERERAIQVAHDPAAATQVLRFDDVQLGLGNRGERWSVDNIMYGDHLKLREKP